MKSVMQNLGVVDAGRNGNEESISIVTLSFRESNIPLTVNTSGM